jgi:hypothetical protein
VEQEEPMKNVLAAFLVILMAGCSGTREITKMEDYLTPAELENPNHQTVDKIKKHYFTEEAYKAIKTIPAIDGPAFSGYSAGVNFWSNVASFVTCNGIGRKVIAPEGSLAQWGVAILVHEYTHHLDDITRDEEGNFLDHEEFKRAFLLMANDMRWRGLYIWAEKQNNMMTSKAFGVGDMSEQIAYIAQHLALKGGPDYMKHVFRKILRLKYKNAVTYTTTDGVKVLLKFGESNDKE